jgi:hypothetical protein
VILTHIEHTYQVRTYEASFVAARETRGTPREALFLDVAAVLHRLAVHGYSDVRKAAQSAAKDVYARCSLAAKAHLPGRRRRRGGLTPRRAVLLETLSRTSAVTPEGWTGSAFELMGDKMMSRAQRRPETFLAVARALVLRAPLAVQALPVHRQAKSQDRLQRVLHKLLRDWQRFPAGRAGEQAGERDALLRWAAAAAPGLTRAGR